MSDLGEARLKVTLDIAEAKRQIAELRQEVNKPVEKKLLATKMQNVAGHPNISGAVSDDPTGGDKIGRAPKSEEELAKLMYRDFMRLAKIDRIRRFAPVHIQEAMDESGLINRSINYGKTAAGLDAASMGTAVGVAKTAGVMYAGVSGFSKLAPYAIEAAKGAGLDVPKSISDAFDDLKRIVNNFENRLSQYAKSVGEASDVWANGARITGQTPDWMYYYNQSYDIGVQESDLKDKFDDWKRKEIANAVGSSIGDMFKGSSTR